MKAGVHLNLNEQTSPLCVSFRQIKKKGEYASNSIQFHNIFQGLCSSTLARETFPKIVRMRIVKYLLRANICLLPYQNGHANFHDFGKYSKINTDTIDFPGLYFTLAFYIKAIAFY